MERTFWKPEMKSEFQNLQASAHILDHWLGLFNGGSDGLQLAAMLFFLSSNNIASVNAYY